MNSKNVLKGSIISVVIMAAAFSFAGIAAAATTSVTPASLNGWYLYNDQNDAVQSDTADHGFVIGPSNGTGVGSVHLTKTSNDSYGIATTQFQGTALSAISSLSYSTYRASGTSAQAASLGFDIDTDSTAADTVYEGRLTYEPYFTQTVSDNTWQTWDTLNDAAGTATGNWWFSHANTGAASQVVTACTQSDPCTWAEVLAAFPNAQIKNPGQLILRTNGGNGQVFNGNVDNLTFNGTTYDFEPNGPFVTNDQGGTYSSLQAAIDGTTAGGTVTVPAGTYDSFSVVNKSGITIKGAGKGSTIIAPTTLVTTGVGHKSTANVNASVFVNNSTNVVIQDMTIQSGSMAVGSGGADAIVFWNASTGTLKNTAVTGMYTVNGIQSGQGVAVDAGAGQTTTLTIDTTDISGFQKNGIDAVNGNATAIGSGTVNVTVTGGSITGVTTGAIAQNGIVVWNKAGGTVTATVNGSTISGFNYTGSDATAAGALAFDGGNIPSVNESTLVNNQLNISTPGSTDATKNYWGSEAGPATTTLEGTVTFSPWYKDAAKTTLTNGVTITTASASSTSTTSSSGVTTTTEIPAGTEISGTDWNGVVEQPTVVASQGVPPSSSNTQTSTILSIEVGSTQSILTLSKAAKLTFSGQAGKLVGWSFNGGAFHTIGACSASITDEASATANLAAGADCVMNVGADLVVWTKHFTVFSVYTETAATVSNGGGGGGGGGNGPIAGSTGTAPLAGATTGTTGGTTGTVGGSTGGQVLGASTFNFTSDLTIGSTGTQVIELQKFLIAQGFSIPSLTAGTATYGYFGTQTRTALAAYQSAHGISPAVGYFGPITRAMFNVGATPTMTDEQRSVLIANLTAQLKVLQAQLAAILAANAAAGH